MLLGVDVGGTHTDAVAYAGGAVVASCKVATTADVAGGLAAALRGVLASPSVDPHAASAVMVGTTHLINAVLERRDLDRVAVVRLALPATASIPPFADWPADLAAEVAALGVLVHGGHEVDGREISPLDEAELAAAARRIDESGATAVAVSAVFSPADPSHELRAAELLGAALPGRRTTCAHRVGHLGLLEREGAAALNACLSTVAERVLAGYHRTLEELGIDAPLFISQNDGTVLPPGAAASAPVLTFASGATNSMRGAACLDGTTEAVVVDIGGTSSDAGALVGGYPRPRSTATVVGGVRTSLRMPDVTSIALGGGSVVRDGGATVGPESVGYRLTSQALVFGGSTLTATDVAVAGGRAAVGDPSLVAHLPPELVARALDTIDRRLAELVDAVRSSPEAVPVVVVGGGAVLVGDHLEGASALHRPAHGEVANAIGAALAQLGAEVDRVVSLRGVTRPEAVAEVEREALEAVLALGGVAGTATVVERNEVPLGYLADALRVRVRATAEARR